MCAARPTAVSITLRLPGAVPCKLRGFGLSFGKTTRTRGTIVRMQRIPGFPIPPGNTLTQAQEIAEAESRAGGLQIAS